MRIGKFTLQLLIITVLLWNPLVAAIPENVGMDTVKLENPITVKYLKRNLKKSGPKLALTSALERNLKRKIKNDPLVENYYQALKANADKVLSAPVLTRNVIGRRLLGTSRDMLHRVNVLGIAYLIENDKKYLDKINEEVIAVSNFSDWNPSHFLDVAEMATAVALAVDWVGDDLPDATVKLAKDALIEKGIAPSWNGGKGRMYGTNNWNQVCNAGMIAAAIVIADQDIELAAKTIHRSGSMDRMALTLKVQPIGDMVLPLLSLPLPCLRQHLVPTSA